MKKKVKEIFFIFFLVVSVRIIPIFVGEFLSPDACLYLDIGRNLFEGKGFITTYNFYQFWKDSSYPAFSFMHPIFCIIAGFLYKLFNTIKAVSIFNMFITYLNILLIYYIFDFLSEKIRLIICALISFNYTMFVTSLFPWTEQLHLFFLLLSFYIFKKFSFKKVFIIGIIMGIVTLVRVANVYNIFGYLIFFQLFSKERFKNIIWFCAGTFLILFPYEVLCFIKCHKFFPEYLLAAKYFGQARLFGGEYFYQTPILRPSVKFSIWGVSYLLIQTTLLKVREFMRFFNRYLGFFLWILPLGIYAQIKSKNRDSQNLLISLVFLIGVINFIFYSISVWWEPRLEIYRYILIPYITFIISSIFLFEKVLLLEENHKKFFLNFTFLILFLINGPEILKTNLFYLKNAKKIRQEIIHRKKMVEYLNFCVQPKDKIATLEYQYAFPLKCSLVSLPEGKVLNEENIQRFLEIYHPKIIWLKKSYQDFYLPFLRTYRKVELPLELSKDYTVLMLAD